MKDFTPLQKKITLTLVLISFVIRVFRLDIPHEWSFDEVYHGLSAEAYAMNDPRGYEWWNQNPKDLAYEWLHPPVGKLLMAASIKLFATPYIPKAKSDPLDPSTTFAWRFPGVIFAALSVYLLIIFGTKLFNNFWIGAVSGFLYGLDGLSFVQSRTGMNDIFITFFVALTFYRLFLFLSEYPHGWKRNMFWLGISSGLAASTKWTGFYAVAIVAVWVGLFLLKKMEPKKIAFAFFYLAIIPVCVYVASYGQWWLQGHTIDQFAELHRQTWWYQTNLKATHDYQSKAYTWPLMLRPVWFYVKYEDHFAKAGQKELWIGNIYTMGNPLIFWAGVGAIGVVLWQIFDRFFTGRAMVRLTSHLNGKMKHSSEELKEKERWKRLMLAFAILLVGYFGMFGPWVFSPRIMFLYHYLPAVPFLCLMLAYVLDLIRTRIAYGVYIVTAYLSLVAFIFIYFYPQWAAVPLPTWWVDQYYWLKSWK